VDLRLDGSLTVQAACIYGQSMATSARQDALRGGLLPIAGQAVRCAPPISMSIICELLPRTKEVQS